MSRKTHKISLAAIAAGFVLIFATVEGSGANAEDTDQLQVQAPVALVDETVPVLVAEPVFVAQEVVQPLPEPAAEIEAAEPVDVPTPDASSLRDMITKVDAPATLGRELECLAGAVYFEARGEPIYGQLGVAQVVINRADSRRFPADYCGVVYQRSQFSFVKNGRMPRIARSSAAWVKAKKIATIAHRGLWDSEVDDALYFHANYVRPSWARKKVATATIDTHIFYR